MKLLPLSPWHLKSQNSKDHIQKEMIEKYFSGVKLCKILNSEMKKILQEI